MSLSESEYGDDRTHIRTTEYVSRIVTVLRLGSYFGAVTPGNHLKPSSRAFTASLFPS